MKSISHSSLVINAKYKCIDHPTPGQLASFHRWSCCEEEQLRTMNPGDENGQSSSSAPLLYADHVVHCSSHEHSSDRSLDVERESSGGWFVWVLTLSAGISGLLFGYEYVESCHILAPLYPGCH